MLFSYGNLVLETLNLPENKFLDYGNFATNDSDKKREFGTIIANPPPQVLSS